MTGEGLIVMAILVGVVVLFVSEKYPLDIVAMLGLGVLLVLGLVTIGEGFSGFSNTATMTVAAMFVLSAGLQKTGATATVGRLMVRFSRNHYTALVVIMVTVTVMSAFVNNTAAVAVFIPLVTVLANRRRIAASKLLIPLSYASQFGGVCTLIGTSTNLLVSAISEEAGYGAFSMFEFTRMGLVLFAAGVAFFLLFGRWLLPARPAPELSITYQLGEYITELRIRGGSPLVGKSVVESRLGEDHDITVLRVRNAGEDGWAPLRRTLQPDDVLLVRGSLPDLIRLRGTMGLRINADFELRDETLQSKDLRVVQALVAPGSRLVGHTLKETDFRNRYRALVLGMQRKGETINDKLSSVRLRLGDALLIQAPEAQIRDLRRGEDLIILNEIPGSVLRHKAPLAIGILVVVVGLAAFDVLPILVAALLGCVALVMTRILQPEDAYRAINWQVIFLLAGVLPLGVAMHNSGAAGWLAEQTVALVGDSGPVAILAAFYLLTAIMTETMSNAAAAVLLAPIAISTAEQIGVDPRPFLMAITFAASTGFSTPVGYQTNTMIYNPGGYKYSDFLRAGVPLNLIFWVLSVIFIPRLWAF
ncbi:MAG: SLC13 family permease [bacterium]|nr:SLC13 family permease [Acidimicrobiia bacterium]MCY4649880.1 SLC13 family permease [bacterium]